MRTVVVSDLHLGGSIGVDVLRREPVREKLKALIAGSDRLVLLGDTLELRHGPAHAVLEVALPILSDIASALDPGTEVVIVSGNHDHALIAPWLDARRRDGVPPPLGIEQLVPPSSGEIAAKVAEAMRPAEVVLAHPGVRLRDDVYAFHGNYLDRHITVPTFERMSAGAMARITGRDPDRASGVDDYEAVLGPMYAWSYEVAQQAEASVGKGAHGFSSRAWQMLAGGSGHRPVRRRVAALGFAGAVGVLNRLRIGPLSSDISGPQLRRAGLDAATAAARAIGVTERHLIFGHTHRPGPLPGDEPSEWITASGQQVLNTGSWVFEQHFLSGAPQGSPYWPGRAVEIVDDEPPRVLSAMNDMAAAEILGGMHPEDD
ncbi:MAG: hypothetical protein WCO96_08190 [Actinomycetes bacterium]